MKVINIFGAISASALFAIASTPAFAASYPEKPVTLVVNFPPAGPVDLLARSLAQSASERLGQAVIVENRPGAAGNLGAAYVARSDPDGYTLLTTIDTTVTANPHSYANVNYDPDQLEALAIAGKYDQVLVVHPDLGVTNYDELVALTSARVASYSSAGISSPGHLQFELLKTLTNVGGQHIPYKGNAPAVQALVSGQVDMGILATAGALPQIREGKLIPILVPGNSREAELPNVPSASELGIEGFDVDGSFLLLAPAGLPDDVARIWQDEVEALFANDEFRGRWTSLTLRPDTMRRDQTRQWVSKTSQRWKDLIKAQDILIE